MPTKPPVYDLFCGDALDVLWKPAPEVVKVIAKRRARLVVIDPPYNIGVDYDSYRDKKPQDVFIKYLVDRIVTSVGVCTSDASFWILINSANVSELDVALKATGIFKPRNRVPWYFTFGQHNPRALTPSHAYWLHYSLSDNYVFNADDPAVRIPSRRFMVYGDKRANPKGRLPDNFWITNPADAGMKAFDPLHDCWTFSRVCGTFKAKTKGKPNQLPVKMLERIVRLCSDPGDVVMDFFNGTGTTGEAALKLGRNYIGIDLSRSCINHTDRRLSELLKTGK